MYFKAQRILGFAVLCIALTPFSPKAQTLGIHVASAHFPQRNYNNVNPGIYYRDSSDITLGAYYNSERKTSFYLGYTLDNETYPVSLTVGAITGYKRAKVLPLVVPSLHSGKIFGENRVRLSLIPRIGYNPAVIHLSLERDF